MGCQLHSNELPLRHFIEHLSGATSGPRGFSESISKSLSTCENLSVIKYRPIECILSDVNREELSTGQKFLFDICKAVSSGDIPGSLVTSSLEKPSHAHWLSTANRVPWINASTTNPSGAQIDTFIIILIYFPIGFQIMTN